MIRNRRVVQGGGVLQSFGAVIASVLAASIFAATAHAQEDLGFFGYGARLGASIEPDQFNVGAYVKLGKVTQMVSFRPSLDLGFGDNLFTVAGNIDGQFDFAMEGPYTPFAGGGLGIIYYDADSDQGYSDDSDTEIGVNLYGGVERDFGSYKRGYVEVRVGIDDLPDLKFTFGFGFF